MDSLSVSATGSLRRCLGRDEERGARFFGLFDCDLLYLLLSFDSILGGVTPVGAGRHELRPLV